MLDERALRREDFRGGVPVKMADGQDWHLPPAEAEFVYDDGEAGVKSTWSLGPEYAALIEAVEKAGPSQLLACELALGRHLLLINYNLATAQLAEVLRFGYRGGLAAVRTSVMEVAWGLAEPPKPTGDGSG